MSETEQIKADIQELRDTQVKLLEFISKLNENTTQLALIIKNLGDLFKPQSTL